MKKSFPKENPSIVRWSNKPDKRIDLLNKECLACRSGWYKSAPSGLVNCNNCCNELNRWHNRQTLERAEIALLCGVNK